jgi:predicted ester cyclase
MPTETVEQRNEAIFRQIISEGFNRGNLAALDELVAPDIVEHQTGAESGLDGLKSLIGGLRTDFPDFKLTIEDLVAVGDKVWARMRGGGTHRAGFFGLPRAGKPMQIDVFDVCRFADGLMVEHWGVPDRFAMLGQLGLLPKPQATSTAE